MKTLSEPTSTPAPAESTPQRQRPTPLREPSITDLQRSNRARMLEFLRGDVPRHLFYFGEVCKESDCGTVGCAIGWTPQLFPEQCEYGRDEDGLFVRIKGQEEPQNYPHVAAELFGLPQESAFHAFTPDFKFQPGQQYPFADDNATPAQVADRIEYVFDLYP